MELISFVIDRLVARLTGPMAFRFILQPTVAILIGIRDGKQDARAGTSPFLYGLLFNPTGRRAQLGNAAKSLTMPVIVGTVLDGIAQYLIFGQIRPGTALLVGLLVMGVPYTVSRGFTNRITTMRQKKKIRTTPS
jgi:hypothetical protein